MSLRTALDGNRDFVINNIAGYSSSNCAVLDEDIFAYVQSTSGVSKCCVVMPDSFDSRTQTEFRSSTIAWSVLINLFFLIEGDDIVTPLNDLITDVDLIISGVSGNSRLDSTVLKATIDSGGPVLPYERANFYYYLYPIRVSVLDNIT